MNLLFEIMLLIQATPPAQQVAQPWWIAAITGSGGALVVTAIACVALWRKCERQDKELQGVTKQSIECITKILGAHSDQKEHNAEVRQMLGGILEKVDDPVWKSSASSKFDRMLSLLENQANR